jgi:hypothetical protein
MTRRNLTLSALATLLLGACGHPALTTHAATPSGELAVHDGAAFTHVDPSPLDMPVGDGPDGLVSSQDITCPDVDALTQTDAGAWTRLQNACHTWASANPKAYIYEIERSFFGPQEMLRPVRISVYDGQVMDAWTADDGEKLNPADYGTVEDLFHEVGEIIQQEPASFSAEYGVTGMPTFVAVDWMELATDDWMTISATLVDIAPTPPSR